MTDRDHQPGRGIDHDLHVRRVPVVLAGRGHRVIPGRYEGAIDDQDGLGTVLPPRRREREERAQPVDDPVHGGGADPEQRRELPHREVGSVVRRHQQHPIGQRQRPLPALDPIRNQLPAPALDLGHQPPERPRRQPGEHLDQLRTRRGEHLLHDQT